MDIYFEGSLEVQFALLIALLLSNVTIFMWMNFIKIHESFSQEQR